MIRKLFTRMFSSKVSTPPVKEASLFSKGDEAIINGYQSWLNSLKDKAKYDTVPVTRYISQSDLDSVQELIDGKSPDKLALIKQNRPIDLARELFTVPLTHLSWLVDNHSAKIIEDSRARFKRTCVTTIDVKPQLCSGYLTPNFSKEDLLRIGKEIADLMIQQNQSATPTVLRPDVQGLPNYSSQLAILDQIAPVTSMLDVDPIGSQPCGTSNDEINVGVIDTIYISNADIKRYMSPQERRPFSAVLSSQLGSKGVKCVMPNELLFSGYDNFVQYGGNAILIAIEGMNSLKIGVLKVENLGKYVGG
jgi:hypothetical protein